MKVTSLLFAVVALSSCVAKPWMVGSVNDHYKMHADEAGRRIRIKSVSGEVASSDSSSSIKTSEKSPRKVQ